MTDKTSKSPKADKKSAPSMKVAAATQKLTKAELDALLKTAAAAEEAEAQAAAAADQPEKAKAKK